MIFKPMTGKTHGMRLRINPPSIMPPRMGRYFERGSGLGGGPAMAVVGIAMESGPARIPENDLPCATGFSKGSSLIRLRVTTQSSPSRVMLPPALAGWRKGSLGMKSWGGSLIEPAGEIRSWMSSASARAVIFRVASARGWLFRAWSNSGAFAAAFSAVAETGRVRGNDLSSLMQLSLQICHFASAVRVTVFPSSSDAGGEISTRNTGLPE